MEEPSDNPAHVAIIIIQDMYNRKITSSLDKKYRLAKRFYGEPNQK
jgi:hypothetical protein